MSTPRSQRFRQALRPLPRTAAAAAALLALGQLAAGAGWKPPLPAGWLAPEDPSGGPLLILALALLAQSAAGARALAAGRVLALAAAAAALLPLVVGSPARAGMPAVAPHAAVLLLLVAGTVGLQGWETAGGRHPSQYLALAGYLLGLQGVLGTLYGLPPLPALVGFPPLAGASALAVTALCAGAALARPDRGPLAVLTADAPSAVVGRRLLLGVHVIPPLLGAVRLAMYRAGWLEPEFGVALVVTATMLLFGLLTGWSTTRLAGAESKRREDEEARARWEQVALRAGWGVALFRPGDLGLHAFNHAFARMHGHTPAGLTGHALPELLAPQTAAALPDLLRRADLEGHLPTETLHCRADASLFPAQAEFTPLRGEDGEVAFWAGYFQDITIRREAEAALRQARDELEERVRDRTVDLARLNEQLSREVAERARAEEQLRESAAELARSNHELELLGEMGELLQSCQTLEEAHRVIALHLRLLFAEECGAVYVYGARADLLESVAEWGSETETEEGDFFPPEDCWALRRGSMHLVTDAENAVVCPHLAGRMRAASVCVPLSAHGNTLGLLSLRREDGSALPEGRTRLAQTVAEQVALSLANLELQETLRRQSLRDPLTGLFNRRYLEATLEREILRAQRGSRSVGVLMIDVDHFKQFNDAYGHDAGDALLASLGLFLRTHVRGEDIPCRYGGEEFTVILPDAALDPVCARAEELRERARQLLIEHGGRHLGPITLSIGVAVYPEHGATGDAVLKSADNALYQAKRGGRDRVMTA